MGYINNVTRRFHVFVANHVQQIHELTQAQQWQYIDTDSNQAVAASRGLTAKQLLHDNYRWFRGPHFLWNPGAYQAEVENTAEPLDPYDPEVKALATQSEESVILTFVAQPWVQVKSISNKKLSSLVDGLVHKLLTCFYFMGCIPTPVACSLLSIFHVIGKFFLYSC